MANGHLDGVTDMLKDAARHASVRDFRFVREFTSLFEWPTGTRSAPPPARHRLRSNAEEHDFFATDVASGASGVQSEAAPRFIHWKFADVKQMLILFFRFRVAVEKFWLSQANDQLARNNPSDENSQQLESSRSLSLYDLVFGPDVCKVYSKTTN